MYRSVRLPQQILAHTITESPPFLLIWTTLQAMNHSPGPLHIFIGPSLLDTVNRLSSVNSTVAQMAVREFWCLRQKFNLAVQWPAVMTTPAYGLLALCIVPDVCSSQYGQSFGVPAPHRRSFWICYAVRNLCLRAEFTT